MLTIKQIKAKLKECNCSNPNNILYSRPIHGARQVEFYVVCSNCNGEHKIA